MKKLFTLLALMLCYVGVVGAETTIGMFQTAVDGVIPESVTYTSMDKVTITSKFGSANEWRSKSTSVYEDGTAYTATKLWRKSGATYDNQNIGFEVAVESGYVLKVSKINARLLVADDTYTWYVEILDANGGSLYTSDELTTKTASTAVLSETIDVTISGKATVNIWLKQGGSTKYYVIDPLSLEATLEEDTRTTHTVSTSVTPEGSGTVTPEGTTTFVEGTDINLNATANTGYKFVKWTVDGNDYTDNPYTISSISGDHTAVATFEALPKISFAAGEGIGTVPSTDYAEVGEEYELPKAQLLVKEGYTLTGWTDGENTYEIGSTMTISGDISLTAVFAKNKASIGDAAIDVDWTFSKKDGAPEFAVEGKIGYYAIPVNINGCTIDAIMTVNTTTGIAITDEKGKWNNVKYENCAQVNDGTLFTIPAVKGMTVTYTATNGTPEAGGVTFGGEEGTVEGKVFTYTYNGEGNTLDIVAVQDALYPSGIKVTYPVKEITLTTADTDFYSLYLPYQAAVPEGMTAYIGALNAEETTLTLTEISGDIPANTGVLVKSTAAGDYTFSVSDATAADVTGNSLKGVTVETAVTELAEEGKTVLTLGVADGIVAFRQPAAWTIKANKVYLLVDAASSAKIRIVEGEATGIEENYEFGIKNSDAATYDLSGRKVANPAKGLYIKSGKKFIVK